MTTKARPLRATALLLAATLVGGPSVTASAASGSPVPDASAGANAMAVAGTEQAFALDLLQRLGPGQANLVLSPSSIDTLLAMLEPGASGATQAGIAEALQSTSLTALQQAQGWGELEAELEAQTGRDHIALDSANQAWFKSGLIVLASYLDMLKADFHTGVQETSLGESPSALAAAINKWAAAHTAGHITNLVTPAEVQKVVTVLVDAVYLDAPWATPFDANRTETAPFFVSPNVTVHVPTMETPELFRAAGSASSSLDAVELPYVGDDLSALVLMPPLGKLAAFERELSAAQLARIVGGLEDQHVNVYLPRFKLDSDLTLNEVLSQMGMGQAFSSNADFSNLSRQSLELSFVVHDAQMTVGEKGTEASAATAGGLEPTAEPGPVNQLTLDFNHPFLFLVRDNSTGLIVFETRVGDPAR